VDLPGAAREVTLWGQGAARNAATTRLRLEVFLRGGRRSEQYRGRHGVGVPPVRLRLDLGVQVLEVGAELLRIGREIRTVRTRFSFWHPSLLSESALAASAVGLVLPASGLFYPHGPPRRLSDAANTGLAAASVQGRDFDLDVVARVTGLPPDEVLDSLEEAMDARLLAGRPGRFRFAHALVREALYGELPSRERRRLHDRAGAALVELRGDDFEGYLAELAITSPRRPVRARPTRPSPSPGRPATGR
jgi:hypothetical protein